MGDSVVGRMKEVLVITENINKQSKNEPSRQKKVTCRSKSFSSWSKQNK